MAFTVQDSNGAVAGANAYVTVQFFKDYHADRGNSVVAGDSGIQRAIVRATDYIDQRFRWVGERPHSRQTTAWPRLNAEDVDGNLRFGIPLEVQQACAEYALIAQSQELNPTPTRDDTGRVVESRSEKVGPIEESATFVVGASFELPKYPKADHKLYAAGLALRGGRMRRS